MVTETEKLIEELMVFGKKHAAFLSEIRKSPRYKGTEDKRMQAEYFFVDKLNQIYDQGVKENVVWVGGNFDVYKKKYEQRLSQAIIDYDISEELFIYYEKGFQLFEFKYFSIGFFELGDFYRGKDTALDIIKNNLYVFFGISTNRIETDSYNDELVLGDPTGFYEFCEKTTDKIFIKIAIQFQQKNDFLDKRLLLLQENELKDYSQYKHPIFNCIEGEQVFYILHKYFKHKKSIAANYSFIFRQMIKSEYLNAPFTGGRNQNLYIEWLSESYSTDVDRIVTMSRIGDLDFKIEKYRQAVYTIQQKGGSPKRKN